MRGGCLHSLEQIHNQEFVNTFHFTSIKKTKAELRKQGIQEAQLHAE